MFKNAIVKYGSFIEKYNTRLCDKLTVESTVEYVSKFIFWIIIIIVIILLATIFVTTLSFVTNLVR